MVQSFTSHWDAPPRAHPGHQKFREANGAILSRGIVEASVCDVICVFVQMFVIVRRCVQVCVYMYIYIYFFTDTVTVYTNVYALTAYVTIRDDTYINQLSSRKGYSSFGLVSGISFQICFPVQVSKRLGGHPKVE